MPNDEFRKYIRNVGVKKIFGEVKFTSSDEEVKRVLADILDGSSQGPRLKALKKHSKELWNRQLDACMVHYKQVVTNAINANRNNAQQALRKVWIKREKEGLPLPTAKQLAAVALRHRLAVCQEDGLEGEALAANQKANAKNQKYWLDLV